MELKDQICSYEQAVRLAELGVKQSSLYCYRNSIVDDEIKLVETYGHTGGYAAYTVAELYKMLILPSRKHIGCVGINSLPDYSEDNGGWYWWPSSSPNILNPDHLVKISNDNQANCCAEVLIYRLCNGLVTAEDINTQQL